MSRRIGRILAFQALYSWDVSKTPLDELLTFDWIDTDVDFLETALPTDDGKTIEVAEPSSIEKTLKTKEATLEDKAFAHVLISGTIDHVAEIDKIIQDHSKTRPIDRISRPTLSILRMSIFSLLFQKDIVEPKVVIDEAISISRDFSTDDSYKFINAVLDKVAKGE